MPQLFHPSANSFAKASIVFIAVSAVAVLFAATAIDRSPYVTQVHTPVSQPVPFSHKHHVAGLGIDCRFCHTSVETSAFAGLPSVETCMTCHSQIWRDSPMLATVRESFASGTPIRWERVNNLPNYAYFQHDIHIHKGVGCETCHGRVDQMALTYKANTLHMDWCIECHRNPAPHLRPRENVFDMGYSPRAKRAADFVAAHQNIETQRITDCATCHR